jgi:hypothetical protein
VPTRVGAEGWRSGVPRHRSAPWRSGDRPTDRRRLHLSGTGHTAVGHGSAMRCPACGNDVPWVDVDVAVPFRCRTCHKRLRVPRAFAVANSCVSGFLAGVIAYRLGARSLALLGGTFLLYFPIMFLVIGFSRHACPPSLRLEQPVGLGLDAASLSERDEPGAGQTRDGT